MHDQSILHSNSNSSPYKTEITFGMVAIDHWTDAERELGMQQALVELSSDDLVSLATKKRLIAREEFLIGRWLSRLLVKTASKASMDEIVHIAYKESGKPYLLLGPDKTPWGLSISHSDRVIAVAVSRQLDIGIDLQSVERTRRTSRSKSVYDINDKKDIAENNEYRDLAWYDMVLNESELRMIRAYDESNAAYRDFIRRWTMKESVVKATGVAGLNRIALVDTSSIDELPENVKLQTIRPNCPVQWERKLMMPLDRLTFDETKFALFTTEPKPGWILSIAAEMPPECSLPISLIVPVF